ncbi:hypothetical protein TNCV_4711321 [Trichonephila clavipes]|uniref:Uncharacterized protein n=1 Tax=Trichonephila clavipes TaxID=2585209 RepID=A0A8X6RWS0_TRICX|nr:hypothetical protein TNCV_4711321 [Trichonephila clavipes]
MGILITNGFLRFRSNYWVNIVQSNACRIRSRCGQETMGPSHDFGEGIRDSHLCQTLNSHLRWLKIWDIPAKLRKLCIREQAIRLQTVCIFVLLHSLLKPLRDTAIYTGLNKLRYNRVFVSNLQMNECRNKTFGGYVH